MKNGKIQDQNPEIAEETKANPIPANERHIRIEPSVDEHREVSGVALRRTTTT